MKVQLDVSSIAPQMTFLKYARKAVQKMIKVVMISPKTLQCVR